MALGTEMGKNHTNDTPTHPPTHAHTHPKKAVTLLRSTAILPPTILMKAPHIHPPWKLSPDKPVNHTKARHSQDRKTKMTAVQRHRDSIRGDHFP